MPKRKLRVHVERTFNRYNRGDELLVEDSDDVQAEIASGLLRLLAVEEPPAPKPKAAKTKSKPKPKAE
jgi:hypothetical protein